MYGKAIKTILGTERKKYPNAILLFRIGDFYKTLDEDAKTLALHTGTELQELKEKEKVQFLTSLPLALLELSLRKLVKAGYWVAICEGLENPKTTKGFVRRGVTDLLKLGG